MVFLQPLLGDIPGFGQAAKKVEVQDILSVGTIESLYVRILRWLSRFDEIKKNIGLFGPACHPLGNQLGAIVHPQPLWITAPGGDRFQNTDNPTNLTGWQRCVNLDDQCLTVEVINHIESAKGPSGW